METKFRGKKIFTVCDHTQYPAVYWPEHPVANKAGIAEVHRIVAYDIWGDEIFGNHVHHKNKNTWDWSRSNLELMKPEKHSYHHSRERGGGRVQSVCDQCGKSFSHPASDDRVYCSKGCMSKGREKIAWPSTCWLRKMVSEYSYTALSRRLGVSDNSIRKRIKNH